ncbi:tyrosine-type recombinase/integrase [Geminocystis sp. NIES-3709]|uniref:tyrosine-type recombinase/integrase n=1 Tax=Geminocystis sp. NIES-3709 TaxID=1617448 RepID=UPI0005FC82FF|nr:tyrosine-type recombinase/integrase [Geminocystis sp. NIES-3709]BAQ67029.1 tyrosine recombinase XerC [Geminocystis sp. NIES-3709]
MSVKHLVNNNNLIAFLKPNPLVSTGFDSIIDDWLARFISPLTRCSYRHAIFEFFSTLNSDGYSAELLAQFLCLEATQAYELVSKYHGTLIERGLAPGTINQRLTVVRSLVNYATEIGKCHYNLANLKMERVSSYRDTTGISTDSFKLMLSAVDRSTLRGKRDYAILLLLWGNALRRAEVTSCNVKDFDAHEKTLSILGKGKGKQAQKVTLGSNTVNCIQEWLNARGNSKPDEPLFYAVHIGYYGHRLNNDSVYKIVKKYAKLASIQKNLSPHRIRHSSITAALDATNGDVRAVQKLSRHSSINTLMIYDDNRRNEQGRVTSILEDLL